MDQCWITKANGSTFSPENVSNHPATASDSQFKLSVPPWLGVHCIVIVRIMTNHRLGGVDHRVAPGGVGSSPAGSAWPKTNSKATLRRMLRDRDRILSRWDKMAGDKARRFHIYGMDMARVDDERRAIRCKLKSLGTSR